MHEAPVTREYIFVNMDNSRVTVHFTPWNNALPIGCGERMYKTHKGEQKGKRGL